MNQAGTIRPMRLWKSILFFLLPGLYGMFALSFLFPALIRFGISEENAYNSAHLSGFILLFVVTFVALRVEGCPFRWETLKKRLRIKRMDSTAWKWTIAFLVLYLLFGLLLNILAQFVYEKLGFWLPDADIPLTNIAFLLILLPVNVLSEELLWRGYILPRQELAYGRFAWIVNGVLWSLFHIFKWWAVPFMLLKHWMLPFVVQRTKNTTPSIVIHFISNGIGVLLSILPLLSA